MDDEIQAVLDSVEAQKVRQEVEDFYQELYASQQAEDDFEVT